MSRGFVTGRDVVALRFLAAHPWATSEYIRRLLARLSPRGTGQLAPQVARRRLGVFLAEGLIGRAALRLYGVPLSAYWITRKGAAFVDLPIGAGGVDIRQLRHDALVADLHLAILGRGGQEVWTARTLASARARGLAPDGIMAPLGGGQVHLPDVVAVLNEGRRVAFEVELSRKPPRRLSEIMRAYRRADALDAVWYLVPDASRAAAVTQAGQGVSRVRVLPLAELIPRPSWPPGGAGEVPGLEVVA